MPVIRIPDITYQRLQAIAIPFEDTPVTVIEWLLSEYEARQQPQKPDEIEKYIVLDPETSDDYLTHTEVIRSVIGGEEFCLTNWKKTVEEAHILAFKQGLSPEALIKHPLSTHCPG